MTHHAPRFDPAAARTARAASVAGTALPAAPAFSSRPSPSAAPLVAPLAFMVPPKGEGAEKPVYLSAALQGGAAKPLFETEEHAVPIHDMRPLAEVGALDLDHEGFELVRHGTRADLRDDEDVRQIYTPEIETFLKAHLGAGRVVVFDATRRSDSGTGAANPDGRRGPASRIHVDYTAKSGPQRVADILGEHEAERLAESGTRIAQVNVWRPITGPVRRSPLALADASSVRARDLVATDQVFPDRTGEIYHLSHDAGQAWYYAPEMTPSEVLLIKGWDSDHTRARFTPHSAFTLPDQDPQAAPRESIEVRTLVVFD